MRNSNKIFQKTNQLKIFTVIDNEQIMKIGYINFLLKEYVQDNIKQLLIVTTKQLSMEKMIIHEFQPFGIGHMDLILFQPLSITIASTVLDYFDRVKQYFIWPHLSLAFSTITDSAYLSSRTYPCQFTPNIFFFIMEMT